MTREEILETAKTIRRSGYWDMYDLEDFGRAIETKVRAEERDLLALAEYNRKMSQEKPNEP